METNAANVMTIDFLRSWKKLTGNWQLNADRETSIIGEYYELYCTVCSDRFAAAVKTILDSTYKFFPTLAEFRGFLPSAERKTFCPICNGNRWILAGTDSWGNSQVKRCDCFPLSKTAQGA